MQITDKKLKTKETQQKQKQSYWSMLINGIVRPPRANYKENLLGSKTFILNETRFTRIEEEVPHQGKRIFLTRYEPQYKNNWIILYLHGNSSSKLQSTSIIRYLPHEFSLASFDFMGCGANQQLDTISLGFREAEQTETVVTFLQERCFKVVIWGRSMGAASALKFGKAPIIIADSSYADFRDLCKQVAHNNSPGYIPNCLISCVFPCVFYKLRKDVQTKGDYDIEVLNILEAVQKINPLSVVIFMSGDADVLIDKQNSEKLYKRYQGKKKYLQIFPGNHNSKRPQQILRKVMRIVKFHADEFDAVAAKQTYSKTKIDLQIQ